MHIRERHGGNRKRAAEAREIKSALSSGEQRMAEGFPQRTEHGHRKHRPKWPQDFREHILKPIRQIGTDTLQPDLQLRIRDLHAIQRLTRPLRQRARQRVRTRFARNIHGAAGCRERQQRETKQQRCHSSLSSKPSSVRSSGSET